MFSTCAVFKCMLYLSCGVLSLDFSVRYFTDFFRVLGTLLHDLFVQQSLQKSQKITSPKKNHSKKKQETHVSWVHFDAFSHQISRQPTPAAASKARPPGRCWTRRSGDGSRGWGPRRWRDDNPLILLGKGIVYDEYYIILYDILYTIELYFILNMELINNLHHMNLYMWV